MDSHSIPYISLDDINIYKKAAAQGDVNALYNLALCSWKGVGVPKDEVMAFQLWKEAADKFDVQSIYNLAICLRLGWGTSKNRAQAFELLDKASKSNVMNQYAFSNKNYPDILDKEGILSNIIQSFNGFGVDLFEGTGIKKNKALTHEFFRTAADEGDNLATMICMLYLKNNGERVNKETEESTFLDKASQNDKNFEFNLEIIENDPEQRNFLANCYLYGWFACIPKDETKGVSLLKQMADQDPQSCYDLALCYRRGVGVDRDLTQELLLLKKAVDMEYPEAIIDLAQVFQMGVKVEKNEQKAIELYEKAIENGDSFSMELLGDIYYKKATVNQRDFDTCKIYYKKSMDLYQQAKALGNKNVIKNLQEIEKQMREFEQLNQPPPTKEEIMVKTSEQIIQELISDNEKLEKSNSEIIESCNQLQTSEKDQEDILKDLYKAPNEFMDMENSCMVLLGKLVMGLEQLTSNMEKETKFQFDKNKMTVEENNKLIEIENEKINNRLNEEIIQIVIPQMKNLNQNFASHKIMPPEIESRINQFIKDLERLKIENFLNFTHANHAQQQLIMTNFKAIHEAEKNWLSCPMVVSALNEMKWRLCILIFPHLPE